MDPGTGGRQLVEDLRPRMAIAVGTADRDDGHGRGRRLQELGVGRRSAVVRDLEQPDAQTVGACQQSLLCGVLGVPGEQDGSTPPRHAQDDRGVVDLAVRPGEGPTPVGSEHLESEVCDGCASTGVRQGIGSDVRGVVPDGAMPHRPDLDRSQDLVEPTHVVLVRVGQDQQVDAADAVATQPVCGAIVPTDVDQDSCAAR